MLKCLPRAFLYISVGVSGSTEITKREYAPMSPASLCFSEASCYDRIIEPIQDCVCKFSQVSLL